MKAFAALSIAALSAAATATAHAEGPSRLDKIRETGVITLGHPETSVPFAYLDGNQKPIGYTVEICQQVAQYVKEAPAAQAGSALQPDHLGHPDPAAGQRHHRPGMRQHHQ